MYKIALSLLISFCTFSTLQAQNMSTAPQKLLRHVVLFKFKDGTAAQDIKKIEDAFRALPSQISLVKDFEWGKNNSPEKLNQGLTHCFLLAFYSEKDRDDYLVHPAHKAFVALLQPFMEKATVIDYWAGK